MRDFSDGKILLVEDERDILEMVQYNLEQAGFDVIPAEDGETALEAVRETLPALIVLDLMLPGIDGLEVCKLLKQDARTRDVPILMLTARSEEVDRIVGLELGADDYVVKPFSPREMVLRIRAILRRMQAEVRDASGTTAEEIRAGPLRVDLAAHRAFLEGAPLALTSTEFKLLVTLIERRGRVQSREDLLNSVWGYEYAGYGRTVDTHIRRLREKLSGASDLVETVRGWGTASGRRLRRMRLHWKLMLTYTCVVVLVVASVHLYLDRAMRAFLVGQLGDTLTREVRLAGAYLRRDLSDRPPPETLDGLADLLGQRLGVRATVTDGTGRVLGDSEVRLEDLAGLESHADRPEIREAWSGRMGRSLRYSATLKQEMLYVAEVVPGVGDGRVVMRLAMPVRDVGQIQKRIYGAVWVVSALVLALVLALAYGGSRFVSRPIVGMTQMARAVASGDFTGQTRVPGGSVRELRDLAGALDGMRRQIQERIGQITVEKSRLEVVLDSITEGMLVTDRDGHVQMTNRAFERLFGTTGCTEGRLPVELVRSGEVQEAIERTLATGKETTQGMTLPGVPERHLDVHVAPILREDACIGSVTVFYDITELLRLERVRKDFVANVSHELRTPLTAIKGCAETLVERALADRGAAERFVQTILSQSDRLQHLLDDLLDLSRLESGKLELASEVCPIRRVVETGIGSVVQRAEEKEIAIHLDVPEEVEVRCDPKLIEQTLINLLDNAVKYTPNGGSVRVVVRPFAGTDSGSERSIPYTQPEAGERPVLDGEGAEARIVLEVTDTGIGISSDALPRVFERFYRVDKGRSRAMGGTGLGLSIVRHIVEAHGERVYARSELGKGSTFGFTLPVVV